MSTLCGFGEIQSKEKYQFTSCSRLVCLREGPELYEAKYIDKTVEDTTSQEFGTLVHEAVLEPELFAKKYVILPDETPENSLTNDQLKVELEKLGLKIGGKKSELVTRLREAFPEFPEQHYEIMERMQEPGRIMISPVIMGRVLKIARKIDQGPAGAMFRRGVKEVMGYWQDPITGLVVRFKADDHEVIGNKGLCLDLKIAADWSPKKFERGHYETGRHIQAAIYLDALTAIYKVPFETFGWPVVEPKSPHRIRYYEADFGMIEAGRQERDYYLHEMKWRLDKNDWSPRPEDNKFQSTTLSTWDWEKAKELIV